MAIAVVFFLTMLLSIVCLIVGLIAPRLFQWLFRKPATRGKLLGVFGLAFFVSFIGFGIFASASQNTSSSGDAASVGTQQDPGIQKENLAEHTAASTPAPTPSPSPALTPTPTPSMPSATPAPSQVASSTATPALSQTPAATSVPEPTPQPTPAGRLFSGNGKQASEQFDLPAGLCYFSIGCRTRGHFAVHLLDSMGERVELLANKVGSYNGSRAVQIEEAGSYLLDVDSDAPWAIRVIPSTAQSGPPLREFSGTSDSATNIFNLDQGLVRVSMQYSGTGHFAIHLLDWEGNTIDLLANQIGSWSGTKALGIRESGGYVMDVQAEGPWSVKIE